MKSKKNKSKETIKKKVKKRREWERMGYNEKEIKEERGKERKICGS